MVCKITIFNMNLPKQNFDAWLKSTFQKPISTPDGEEMWQDFEKIWMQPSPNNAPKPPNFAPVSGANKFVFLLRIGAFGLLLGCISVYLFRNWPKIDALSPEECSSEMKMEALSGPQTVPIPSLGSEKKYVFSETGLSAQKSSLEAEAATGSRFLAGPANHVSIPLIKEQTGNTFVENLRENEVEESYLIKENPESFDSPVNILQQIPFQKLEQQSPLWIFPLENAEILQPIWLVPYLSKKEKSLKKWSLLLAADLLNTQKTSHSPKVEIRQRINAGIGYGFYLPRLRSQGHVAFWISQIGIPKISLDQTTRTSLDSTRNLTIERTSIYRMKGYSVYFGAEKSIFRGFMFCFGVKIGYFPKLNQIENSYYNTSLKGGGTGSGYGLGLYKTSDFLRKWQFGPQISLEMPIFRGLKLGTSFSQNLIDLTKNKTTPEDVFTVQRNWMAYLKYSF